MWVSQSNTPSAIVLISVSYTSSRDEIVAEVPEVALPVDTLGRVVVPRQRIPVREERERCSRIGVHERHLTRRALVAEGACRAGARCQVSPDLAIDHAEQGDVRDRLRTA